MANARRKWTKMDEERFNRIKVVLDNVPKGKHGTGDMYKALGISNRTAATIRNSESYQDYRNRLKAHSAASKKQQPKATDNDTELVLARTQVQLDRIESKLDKLLSLYEQELDVFERLSDTTTKSLKERLLG